MAQRRQDSTDNRSRYTHQAYDVSYFGKSKETAPSGYTARLSGSYMALITVEVDMSTPGDVSLGDITEGLSVIGVINHVALSTGTVALKLPAFNGDPEIVLNTTPVAVTAGAVVFTGVENGLPPISKDRPLVATVAAGTADETAVISLMVCPIESGWK